MGLLSVITWPARTLVAVIKSLIKLCIAVILYPFRLIASILRWIVQKFQTKIGHIKTGVQSLRQRKPLSYLFPLTPAVTADNVDHLDAPISDEEYNRNPAFSHGSIRHRHYRPTSQSAVAPHSESYDETQSIASLIQDLIKLSQSDSDKDERKDDPNQKVLQLLHDRSTTGEGDTGNNDNVSTMLDDLGTLESYLSQFVYEQSRTESLETIIEESTSKESSPSTAGSPVPRVRSIPPPGDTIVEEDEELTVSQNEISQTLLLLQKLTNSEDLKTSLREVADVHRPPQDEFETPPTSMSSSQESSPENPLKNRAAAKQSLQEQQDQFIKTQQQLQNVMDSLNVHTLDQATPPTNPAPPPEATPIDLSNEIYDSLADPIPVYSRLEKKPHPPDELPVDEQIYDSVEPMSKQEQPSSMTKSETPPPVPIRRTYSGGSTTDSGDNSPSAERRLHRRHSHHGGDGEHRRRHRRRHHHCRHCDDFSPDRCSHRPRSRERHHHHHHRHRSNSDESRESTHRNPRGYHESSGYESHPQEHELESPVPPRRKQRTNSDASSTGTPSVPATPKEGRRGFLGFFTKKSTSLTSLESTKSENGEKGSIQSYKM